MNNQKLGWQGILIRFLAATILVFASYNPEGYSYYDWGIKHFMDFDPLRIFAGIILLIGWVIFIRAAIKSLGFIGLTLAFGFFGSMLWVIIDWGLIPTDNVRAVSYIILFILTAILTTGMSWSHIRRRMSGQSDVDEVDS